MSIKSPDFSLLNDKTKMTTRFESKDLFFHFYFLIQDSSLNIALIFLKLYKHVDNINLKGTLSQISDIGPSFIFMSKKGKIFIIFS